MPEGSIFNQPNTIYGLFFFLIQLLLRMRFYLTFKFKISFLFCIFVFLLSIVLFRNNKRALRAKILLSVFANIGNLYLAYVLYFILKDFCIVCVSTYIVNILLLVFNYKHKSFYNQMNEFINANKKEKAN